MPGGCPLRAQEINYTACSADGQNASKLGKSSRHEDRAASSVQGPRACHLPKATSLPPHTIFARPDFARLGRSHGCAFVVNTFVLTAGGARYALRRTRSRTKSHLGAEHNQRLWPSPREFWVGGTLAALGHAQNGAVQGRCAWLWGTHAKEGVRSTALPRCSAPRARRGRACDGPAFRHAGRCLGPTTAAERLALPTPFPRDQRARLKC